MGKFQGTGYINPLSAKLTDRGHTAPAAAKSPKPAVERATTKVRKAVSIGVSKTVSKTTGALTNAGHQARWRKAHPKQHADQQRAARARRKATAQTSEVASR
jgi:hypothetical protein